MYKRFMRFVFAVGLFAGVSVVLTGSAHAAPATFTVTNTDDSGPGSLRQAIEDANNNGNSSDTDIIQFNIAGPGVHTITPASMFPAISQSVIINGYSQSGTSANTANMPNPLNGTLLIELNGVNAGDASQQAGLALIGDNITVQGLAIFGFSVPKNPMEGASTNVVTLGQNAKVQGCYIGVRADGLTIGPDGRDSIALITNGPSDLIGGTLPAQRNVIFSQSTILQSGAIFANTGSIEIYGNYIGLAKDGVTDLSPESADPLQLSPPYNIGVNSLNDVFMRLGGANEAAQNIISGNEVNVAVSSNVNDDRVQGNKIGTDYAGVVRPSITNGYGVTSSISDANLIGGTGPGEGNLIAGNSGAAVAIFGGINDADGSLLGGTTRFTVLGNTIFGNQLYEYTEFGAANLGIDLFAGRVVLGGPSGFEIVGYSDLGPNPNDPGDTDSGANNYINTPILKTAQQVGNDLTITYDLDAADSTSGTYRVEFFANNEATIFGTGPGEEYLGSATVTPGTNKTVTLTVSGDYTDKALSATTTAIDATTDSGFGSTSEFARNISIGSASDFDADGIADSVEDAGPNNGDGNNDGTPDREQPTVTTYEIDSTGIYATLVTDGCSENGTVASVDFTSLNTEDTGYVYPYGLTDFTLNCSRGDTVDVTMYIHTETNPDQFVPRKYNATTQTFFDIPGATLTTEEIGVTSALKLNYSITDGGDLDDDGEANGIIIDPMGLATTESLAETGESQLSWLAFVGSAIGAGAIMLTRQRRHNL